MVFRFHSLSTLPISLLPASLFLSTLPISLLPHFTFTNFPQERGQCRRACLWRSLAWVWRRRVCRCCPRVRGVGGGRGLCCPQWMATSVCWSPQGWRQHASEASAAVQMSLWLSQRVPPGGKRLPSGWESPRQKGCFLATGGPTWRLSGIVGHAARGERRFSASATQRNLWGTLPPRPVNQSCFRGWDTALALWKALRVISGCGPS